MPWVAAPDIYEELSGETVLTMEYLPGVSLKDVGAIDEREDLDAKLLATRLGQAYFLQFCKHGFFNTDPHAGNLAADGAFSPGGRLIFYDFGQAARLDASEMAGALQLLEGIIDADAEATVDAFEQMKVLKAGYDRPSVVKTIDNNFKTGLVKSKAMITSVGPYSGWPTRAQSPPRGRADCPRRGVWKPKRKQSGADS